MINVPIKFSVGKAISLDKNNPDTMQGLVLDKIIQDGNTKYLVIVNPTKALLLISPDQITEIVGASFHIQQGGGLHG